MDEKKSAPHPVLGGLNLIVGLLTLGGIWVALPTRWWPVDVFGTLLGALLALAGVGLFARRAWGRMLGVAASGLTLLAGMVVTATLALTAGELSGLYGPVGMGGALILALVFITFIPYFVVFPAAALYFLVGPDERA